MTEPLPRHSVVCSRRPPLQDRAGRPSPKPRPSLLVRRCHRGAELREVERVTPDAQLPQLILEDKMRCLDPWAGEWVTRDELVARCERYARESTTLRRKIRRAWRRLHGIEEPDARWFVRHAQFLRTI